MLPHTRTLMHLSLATHVHTHFLRSTHSLSLIHSFSLFLSSIQNRRSRACCMPYPLSLSHTHTHTHALTVFLRRIFVIDLVRQMRANFIPLDLLSRFIRAYLSLSLSLFHTRTPPPHTLTYTLSLSLCHSTILDFFFSSLEICFSRITPRVSFSCCR